jgi:hypothetical protein
MYVQYIFLNSVPATFPISGLPLICSHKLFVQLKELPEDISPSKTVVFLEAMISRQKAAIYDDAITCHTNADLEDAELGSMELSAEIRCSTKMNAVT